MKISLTILVVLLLVGVIYLTWENRDSNTLVLKVLSFFTVGLLSIVLTVFLQDKKESINYKTTTTLFVDKNEYPITYTYNIEKKDDLILDVLTSLNKVDLKNETFYKEINQYQQDFISRVFIHLLEKIFYNGWYVNYSYNKLTNGTSWGRKGNEKSDLLEISDIDIFENPNFKFKVEGIFDKGIKIPKGTEVFFNKDHHIKTITFKHKYFTYKIEIVFNSFWKGFGKYKNLFQNFEEGSTYYFDIKTSCTFSELYPNNPMIKKYEEWVNNTNKIIDFHFNTYRSIENYDKNKERRRLLPGNYKIINN
jgi:hypothetical protein